MAFSCLVFHDVANRYGVEWSNGLPRIVPNPKEDEDYQPADDCADNLRQCLRVCELR